jgi:hypothetical protein
MAWYDRFNPLSGDFLKTGISPIDENFGFFNQFATDLNAEKGLNELGFSNTEAVKEGQQAYDDMTAKADAAYAQNEADLQRYYQTMADKYGGDEAKRREAIERYLNGEPVQVQDFSYDKSVEDFFDPAAAMRAQNAMTAINNAAGSEGSRFSSDFLNRQAAKQQALASEEWEKSYDRLMRDREAQMNQWRANADNKRANATAADERIKAAIDIYGQGSEKADQAFADLIAGLVGNRQSQTQTDMDAVSGKTDLGMNQEKGVGGAASTIFKAIFG